VETSFPFYMFIIFPPLLSTSPLFIIAAEPPFAGKLEPLNPDPPASFKDI